MFIEKKIYYVYLIGNILWRNMRRERKKKEEINKGGAGGEDVRTGGIYGGVDGW